MRTLVRGDLGGTATFQLEPQPHRVREKPDEAGCPVAEVRDLEGEARLESDGWQEFEDFVADSGMLRAAAVMAGVGYSSEAAEEGVSGDVGDPGAHPGLGMLCLDRDDTVADVLTLSLAEKLRVLDCLIFHTPQRFYQKTYQEQSDGTFLVVSPPQADSLKDDVRFAALLGFGDWECTKIADAPLPSCLRHDIAWDSLRKFMGGDRNDDSLDQAWNPRNKAVSDLRFRADVLAYGCQDSSDEAVELGVCSQTNLALAKEYYWGVAKYNTKGWPVTEQDMEHIGAYGDYEVHDPTDYSFYSCDNPVHNLVDLSVTQKEGGVFVISWGHESGCVSDISIDIVQICLSLHGPDYSSKPPCLPALPQVITSITHTDSFWSHFNAEVAIFDIDLTPANRIYGGPTYKYKDVRINVEREGEK